MKARYGKMWLTLLSIAILFVVGCGGGGGGSDTELSTNACSVLGLNTRIINGTACQENSSPVVLIGLFNGGGTLTSICSGSLITSRHVLTAGHCFVGLGVAAANVVVGGEVIPVSSYTVHPGYRPDNTAVAVFNDLAVVTLNRAAGVAPLSLVVTDDVESGDVISIFGYGTDESQTVGELKSSSMQVSGVTADHVSAGFDGEGGNTCTGDSGGPALFQSQNGLGIVGVTSSGSLTDCGEGDLSLFANTASASALAFITSVAPGVSTL